jgi:RHO1 GDP-GTP exchange protein 1/2
VLIIIQPIPLELLLISATDEFPSNSRSAGISKQKTLMRRNSFTKTTASTTPVPSKVENKGGFAITFMHLGRKYYQITLWASTYVSQRKWVENITKQQDTMRERSLIFDTVTLSESFFVGANKVNCAAPFSEFLCCLRSQVSLIDEMQVARGALSMAQTTECIYQT